MKFTISKFKDSRFSLTHVLLKPNILGIRYIIILLNLISKNSGIHVSVYPMFFSTIMLPGLIPTHKLECCQADKINHHLTGP